MSTRIGMADGRCLTEFTSNRLLTDAIYDGNKIDKYDNYSFRMMAQQKGPEGFQGPLRNAACRSGEVSVLVSNAEGSDDTPVGAGNC